MASSIVTSVAEKLGGSLVDEAKYLYQVSDKVKSLQDELEWMACFLEDADNREYQEKIVCKWVSEIRDIAYDAEDLIERYLHEVSHHRHDGILSTMKWFSCCIFDVVALYSFGSSIDELRDRISNLIPRMQMYGIQNVGRLEGSKRNIAMREQGRTYSHIEEDPVGVEKQVKAVVGQLLENEAASVIGITGMGGLGKTTLARKVFSYRDVKEHFQNKCAWIYLSKEFDRRHVFEEILIGLLANEDQDIRKETSVDQDIRKETSVDQDIRKKVRELADDELPRRICKELKAKECLVVIDDIWYTHSWDSLKPAFESIKSTNSRILITTRNKSLTHYADANGYTHYTDKLSDEDSWELLKRKAFLRREEEAVVDGDTAKMEDLGKEMVKHCNGLPLAIIALGGILAVRRTVKEWEIVRKNISSYLMCDTVEEGGDGEVLKVLEMSFYDLPFYLKPCFLYLGSFPEDYEIRSQRLYQLWEAEGLVSRVIKGVEVEGISLHDIAESYLNQLVQRSMVQVYKWWPNGSIKSCRMHDIMRDMCIQKCKDVNFLSIVDYGKSSGPSRHGWSSSLGHTKWRRCSLHLTAGGSESTQQPEKYANIRSFLIFPLGSGVHVGATLKQLSQGMGTFFSVLRVLDLQGAMIVKLPKAFKSCIHMRYLNLKGTYVIKVSRWILHLEYLETLDLRSDLGSEEDVDVYHDFRMLKRLRHLYLPMSMDLKGFRKVKWSDDQLQQMETLKNFNMGTCREEDLEKMVNLRIFNTTNWDWWSKGTLELFSRSPMFSSGCLINCSLKIKIRAKIINEEPTILMTIGKYLKGLRIKGRIEVGDAKIFYDNMEEVELYGCEIGESHLGELEKLPYLKSLGLQHNAIKGSKMCLSEKAFPRLEGLALFGMRELEELEVGAGALPNLRTWSNWACPKLKRLPQGKLFEEYAPSTPRGLSSQRD